jgi:hypothetical protein
MTKVTIIGDLYTDGAPDHGLPGGPEVQPPGGRPGHLPARDRFGRPVDPGYGVEGGGSPDHGFNPANPDQSLPGGPGRPERPPHPGRPERPEHPSHRPPWAGRPKPEWPPGPTDPNWGVDAPIDTPEHPIHLPGTPDHGLPGEPSPGHPIPPVAGHPLPPDLPPGSIWPPLPPDAPTGKHMFLIWIQGVGLRYGSFEIPQHETDPGYGVDEGGTPGHDLPGRQPRPPQPGQPLPPTGRPPQAGQPLPGQPGRPNPTPEPHRG